MAHRARAVSAAQIASVVEGMYDGTRLGSVRAWKQAVANLVVGQRPDIAGALQDVLGVEADEGASPLSGLTVGQISACYEALLARVDTSQRKGSGQFFTPDDVAQFMAAQAEEFPVGRWLDPACGVGNLAWHLVDRLESGAIPAADVGADTAAGVVASTGAGAPVSADFVSERLSLCDADGTALATAVALIAGQFAGEGDERGVRALAARSVQRDSLSEDYWPEHDYVIMNPPYARAEPRDGYSTSSTRDLYAFFMEKAALSSRGYIAVTPASYLSAPKYQVLRDVVGSAGGGRIYVFDNVPDTLFRGYKFGSTNTSKTNFVRAAVTVSLPEVREWAITPILRWRRPDRERMFAQAPTLLTPRRIGPDGEWVKVGGALAETWDHLRAVPRTVRDLVTSEITEFSLTVALTPRYYVSAAYRDLDRGSKMVLYFGDEGDRDACALALNSSIPYFWWRTLDGGVMLPRRVLLSTPVPEALGDAQIGRDADGSGVGGSAGSADPTGSAGSAGSAGAPWSAEQLLKVLREDEDAHLVTKLNAGRVNENVKRPPDLVNALDRLLFGGDAPDFSSVYADSMFPA